ncbi:MAG: serine hydrolase domain-containing protein [Isosphaeraceae bacterium]
MCRSFILALTLALVSSPAHQVAAQSSEAPILPAIRAAMRKCVDNREVAGAVTLVAAGDQIVHIDAVGKADLEANRPMLPDQLFWIASMTKPITGAAVMMMQDEGKLRVDDLVEKHIPEFAGLKTAEGEPAKVTIRHLLTHTSGLAEMSGRGRGARPVKTLAEAIPYYVNRPVAFKPGSKWVYCQSGMNTAARVVEIVSGKTFDRFCDERIFGPLGMKDTTFYPTKEQLSRLARSYARKKDGTLEADPLRMLGGPISSRERMPMANGGLFSTASDYYRFYRMLLDGGRFEGKTLLKPESVRQMTTVQSGNVRTGFTPGNGWGLGVCVVREPQGVTAMLSKGTFGHGGAFGTQAWVDPKLRRIDILMVQRTNFANSDDSPVRLAFQKAAALATGSKGQ